MLGPVEAPSRLSPAVLRANAESRDIVYMHRDEMKLRMEGQPTFVHAVNYLSEVSLEAADAAGLTLDEIDIFIYHQANARIVKAVGERLALPTERVVDCIESFGNTSAASIPLALDWAERRGRLRPGSRALLAAVGAGFTWGAVIAEWGSNGG